MILDIVDIFETPDEKRQGLQYRSIKENDCAIFLYDVACYPSFWNINVPTDLYVTSVVDGKTADSFVMDAGSTAPHKVGVATHFVIESRVEIPVGVVVDIDPYQGRWVG